MTTYTYDQVADILLQKDWRLTKDLRLPKPLLGGKLRLPAIFKRADFAYRDPTPDEQLVYLGFNSAQISAFKEVHRQVEEIISAEVERLGDKAWFFAPDIHAYRYAGLQCELDNLGKAHPELFITGDPPGQTNVKPAIIPA